MKVRSSRAKRFAKIWARQIVTRLGGISVAHEKAQLSAGLRILAYHRIADDSEDPFAVSPASFSVQMDVLSKTGAVVSLEDGLDAVRHFEIVPPRIAITFDDGTEDFLTVALPVLQRLSLQATAYVNPSRVGSEGFLDWAALRGVAEGGVRVGSHGLHHRSLGRLRREEVWDEVSKSREILENQLGCAVSSIAYPFGTLRDFNRDVKQIVRDAGYTSACTAVNGVNRERSDFFELRRTKIEQGDANIFMLILQGHLDRWAWVDRHFAGLQNRYSVSSSRYEEDRGGLGNEPVAKSTRLMGGISWGAGRPFDSGL